MHKKKQYKLVILVRTSVHIAQLILYFFACFYNLATKTLEPFAGIRS